MTTGFKIVQRGLKHGDSVTTEHLSVKRPIALKLRKYVDFHLRENWDAGPFIGIWMTDRQTKKVEWWSAYHGHINTAGDDQEEFERSFLAFAEERPMLCVKVSSQRNDYYAYIVGSDPEVALNELVVADVLLT